MGTQEESGKGESKMLISRFRSEIESNSFGGETRDGDGDEDGGVLRWEGTKPEQRSDGSYLREARRAWEASCARLRRASRATRGWEARRGVARERKQRTRNAIRGALDLRSLRRHCERIIGGRNAIVSLRVTNASDRAPNPAETLMKF